MPYKNLVLSGGGIRGICHLGALHVLTREKRLALDQLEHIMGVSAGALIGMFIVLRMSLDEMVEYSLHHNLSAYTNPSIFNLIQCYGMDTGEMLHSYIHEFIYEKTGLKQVTFRDLYTYHPILFTVGGTCITDNDMVFFNHLTHPDMLVADAIRISVGVPGFFAPFTWNGKAFIDGGMLDNFPIQRFSSEMDKTIGLWISNACSFTYTNLESYLAALLNMPLHYFQYKSYDVFKENIIKLVPTCDGISAFTFSLTLAEKQRLYQQGIECAETFIQSCKPESIAQKGSDMSSNAS